MLFPNDFELLSIELTRRATANHPYPLPGPSEGELLPPRNAFGKTRTSPSDNREQARLGQESLHWITHFVLPIARSIEHVTTPVERVRRSSREIAQPLCESAGLPSWD